MREGRPVCHRSCGCSCAGDLHFRLAPWLARDDAANSVSSEAEVQACAAQLGIGKNTKVIAYDDMGSLFAARFWWVMSMYGHDNVQVLHAGWRGAANSGAKVESGPCQNPPSADVDAFTAQRRDDWFASTEDMVAMSLDPPVSTLAQLACARHAQARIDTPVLVPARLLLLPASLAVGAEAGGSAPASLSPRPLASPSPQATPLETRPLR